MPQRRTRPHVEFGGRSYALDVDGYWKTAKVRGHKQRLLHRDIWEVAKGRPIPDGWHVHHDDENKANNDPTNLVAMPASKHAAHHAPDRGWSAWTAEQRSDARRRDRATREPTERVCQNPECAAGFASTGQRAKYCTPQCRRAANRDRNREQERARYDPAARRLKHDRTKRGAAVGAGGAGVRPDSGG